MILLNSLSSLEWIYVIIIGIMDTLGFLLLNKAIFMHNPGKISIFRYFGSVIQLIFDVTIFNVEFYGL